MLRQTFISLLVACALAACSPSQRPLNPTGTWHATVKNPSGEQVAFTLQITQSGNELSAALLNDTEELPASTAILTGDLLKIRFDFYDGTLEARLQNDQLAGTFTRQWEKKTLARDFHATRTLPSSPPTSTGPQLPTDWLLKVQSGDTTRLWRAAFHTSGSTATGTIITIGGDWGLMSGTWLNGQLTLNHFDGINARLLRLTAQNDGTLKGEVDLGLLDPKRTVLAQPITEANNELNELVSTLPDPASYTRMKNPTEPFHFAFPDLNGQTISWTDPRFKNKVLAISITGSWCPNCHEETPFMQSLYQKYQSQGFEVVALAFEYTGDAPRDREQLRLFAQRHSVTFPALLAGTTDDATQKLDQLANFSAFPTTLFIGRDGLVKHIHAGFEGSAAGDRSSALKAAIESLVQQLLAEK